MNYCKKCGATAPEDHDVCWCCEHETKLTRPKEEMHLKYQDNEKARLNGGHFDEEVT